MEGERLGASEPALHGNAQLIGGKRGQVLHRDVLLAAKAASHEHGLNHHTVLLIIPAEHVRALLARVVGTLVGGPDLDPVLVGGGHGALGLQEGVFGEGRGEGLGCREGTVGKGRLGVAARDVALLADVVLKHHVVAEGLEALVDERGTGRHGLVDVADGLELLVGDLHELLCLGHRCAVLGHNERDGVAHAARDVTLGDHDVPVLDEVAHLVHRHVGRRIDGEHAGELAGLLGVDGDHAGARVGRTDGRGVGQVLEIALVEVVGVLAVSQDLAADVGAKDLLAHAVVLAELGGRVNRILAAQDGGGELDGHEDALVAGAAADVAADGLGDLGAGGVGVAVDEGGAGKHHAGDTEAALHRARNAKGVDEGLLLLVGEALDGGDGVALGQLGGEHARLHRAVVNDDGAGAAGALGAAVLDARELEVVAQEAKEGLVLVCDVLLPVDEEVVLLCHGFLPYLSATMPKASRMTFRGHLVAHMPQVMHST